jgi:putative transposase
MPEYRRAYVAGGTYFLTVVTHRRAPILGGAEDVADLRRAVAEVKRKDPFEVVAAVVMPDHAHFLWSLPGGDTSYSRRVGRMKVGFSRHRQARSGRPAGLGPSGHRHRESGLWQRRFWEHTIRDENDLERHLDYIHWNPVKHGLATCPHVWPYSSFKTWVRRGLYPEDWGCRCDGRTPTVPDLAALEERAGE